MPNSGRCRPACRGVAQVVLASRGRPGGLARSIPEPRDEPRASVTGESDQRLCQAAARSGDIDLARGTNSARRCPAGAGPEEERYEASPMGPILNLNRTSWLARRTRGLWPDRNPLRRATDRAELVVVAGLTAAFLVGSPVAAMTAGHAASAAGLRAEQTARFKVDATLMQSAPGPFYSPYGSVVIPVPARWIAPDGSRHAGPVDADAAARAGSDVTVWTTKSGKLIAPSPPAGQVTAT